MYFLALSAASGVLKPMKPNFRDTPLFNFMILASVTYHHRHDAVSAAIRAKVFPEGEHGKG
jgi:hypothetical protein